MGSNTLTSVDIRVVAATNKDLRKMVEEETFREDLYYRLGVIHVFIPPLRERRDELSVLIEYFLVEASRELGKDPIQLHPRLYAFFETYQWPGNIRELKNVIYRISCLADERGDIPHLPVYMKAEKTSTAIADTPELSSNNLSHVRKAAGNAAEKQFLMNGLHEVNGKVTELAERLDMSRTYLQRLLRQHNIKSKEFKQPAPTAKGKQSKGSTSKASATS